MGITLQNNPARTYSEKQTSVSLWKKFILWSEAQEENRFLWVALAIAGHGCVFTILTVITIVLTGNHFIFWPFAIGAMAASLISNLAAMPTKVTIPILFFSLLVDLAIIVLCFSSMI